MEHEGHSFLGCHHDGATKPISCSSTVLYHVWPSLLFRKNRHTHIQTHGFSRLHSHTRPHIHTDMLTYLYTHTYPQTPTLIHTFHHTNTHSDIHTYLQALTYTLTRTHKHTLTLTFSHSAKVTHNYTNSLSRMVTDTHELIYTHSFMLNIYSHTPSNPLIFTHTHIHTLTLTHSLKYFYAQSSSNTHTLCPNRNSVKISSPSWSLTPAVASYRLLGIWAE